jgi:hypothetical protein
MLSIQSSYSNRTKCPQSVGFVAISLFSFIFFPPTILQDRDGLLTGFVEGTAVPAPEQEAAFVTSLSLFCRLYHNFLLITDGVPLH